MRFNVQHIVKGAVILMASVSTAVACFGQGQIQFATFNVDSTKGQVFAADGITPLGSTYYGQLLGGTSPNSLSPIGTAVAFFSNAGVGTGYINSPTTVNIPGTFGGDTYYYALAAWAATAGTTYPQALSTQGFVIDSRIAGATVGTGIAQITLGGTPAGGGTPLGVPSANGFNNFSLVPEPSTVVLGLLGAAALLLRRRK